MADGVAYVCHAPSIHWGLDSSHFLRPFITALKNVAR